jgi:FLVCR family MFS transporter 7
MTKRSQRSTSSVILGSGGVFAHIPPDTGMRKWLMVGILSLLSGLNQAICYSYAPLASLVESRWHGKLHSTELITVFFISYIPCSFFGSWLMDRKGLKYGVLLGGLLQAIGASLRFIGSISGSWQWEVYITLGGQILASIAMPFMVNSPPVLSANWFPPSLRATSTSIAVNCNAMGVCLVYLMSQFVVETSDDLPKWNFFIAVLTIAAWLSAVFCFRSFPPKYQEQSEANGDLESIVSDVQLTDEYDWKQWFQAFSHQSFWITVLGFSIAECVVNSMSALLGKFLSTEGFAKSEIGLIGAAFIVSSLVGGQVISRYVDLTRCHQLALQFCLVLTAGSLIAFKLTLEDTNVFLTLASLMFVGLFLGPIQPIVLELGVECAFPTSEATVAALQQLSGNFLSAILVPGMSLLRRYNIDSSGHVPISKFYACPEWIMVFLMLGTSICFWFL